MCLKKILITSSLLLSRAVFAVDDLPTYDAQTLRLQLPVVKVGRDYLSAQLDNLGNFVFKVRSTTVYSGVPPESHPDYNPYTGVLILPRVKALGKLWQVTLQHQDSLLFHLLSATEDLTQATVDPIEKLTPTQRFLINTDGTVTDQYTGLQWMRCSFGQIWNGNTCSGFPVTLEMEDATYAAYTLVFAGKTDWRLPTIDELKSLVYCSSGSPKFWNTTGYACSGAYQKPTLAQDAFPFNAGGVYWSISNLQNDPGQDYNLTVSFNYGHVYYSYFKDAFELARFVRGTSNIAPGMEVTGGFKE